MCFRLFVCMHMCIYDNRPLCYTCSVCYDRMQCSCCMLLCLTANPSLLLRRCLLSKLCLSSEDAIYFSAFVLETNKSQNPNIHTFSLSLRLLFATYSWRLSRSLLTVCVYILRILILDLVRLSSLLSCPVWLSDPCYFYSLPSYPCSFDLYVRYLSMFP